MSVPNLSSLAGLEVPEKFVVVGWGGVGWGWVLVVVEHVATVSNPTKLLLICFALSSVELGFDNFLWK